MTATAARETSGRLLNRELSWLDFNARLLELAADDTMPLLERVKFCWFFSSNLDEFFMVRVAGLHGPGRVGRSPCARTDGLHAARRRSPRSASASIELTDAPGEALEARQLPPALAAAGHRCRAGRRSRRRRARRARAALPARDLPGADAARGRPRPAVPVHLRALAQPRRARARPRHGRGALRAREGARAAAALHRGRHGAGGCCRSRT